MTILTEILVLVSSSYASALLVNASILHFAYWLIWKKLGTPLHMVAF
ncbi:MAG: hypothetical protein ACRBFS_06885 [Aureispira sp.]